ncbi:hypothetical protein EMGBS15_00260 [Filimonas sp.]|nr:hypothetical protein EMGBS15_00260 [Filimonas sp.]
MRKILLIGLFIFAISDGFGQKIVLSEKEELNLRNDDFMVIGQCRKQTVVYKHHEGIGEIIFYNASFVKDRISTLAFLPTSFLKIFFSNSAEHLSVFYVLKENRKLNVYMSALKEDFSWTEPVLLQSSPSGSYRNSHDYHFCSSEDNTKTLVYTTFDENEITVLQARVVDESLVSISDIKQSITDRDLYISETASVSNDGAAFMVAGDVNTSKGNIEKLTLLSGAKGASTLTVTPMNLNQYAVSDIHLTMDNPNNNLYVSGYFADGRYSSPRGIYFSVFDMAAKGISSNHFTPLTLQISSSRTDLRDLKIRNVFLKKTGEIEIVAEKTYQNARNVGSAPPVISSSLLLSNMADNTRIVQEFSYEEIALFNLKTDGSLAWSQTILKDQTTTDDNGIFSSFGVLQHRLGHVFLFSDMSSKQSRLLACYVSANGELTVKELQSSEEVDEWSLMPRSSVQLSKSEIVMPCVSKNYLCFLKISY